MKPFDESDLNDVKYPKNLIKSKYGDSVRLARSDIINNIAALESRLKKNMDSLPISCYFPNYLIGQDSCFLNLTEKTEIVYVCKGVDSSVIIFN